MKSEARTIGLNVLAFFLCNWFSLFAGYAIANEPSGSECTVYFAGSVVPDTDAREILKQHSDWSGVAICLERFSSWIVSIDSLHGPYEESGLQYYRMEHSTIDDLSQRLRSLYVNKDFPDLEKREFYFVCEEGRKCQNGSADLGTNFAGISPSDFRFFLGYRDAVVHGKVDLAPEIQQKDFARFMRFLKSARAVGVIKSSSGNNGPQTTFVFRRAGRNDWGAVFADGANHRPVLVELFTF